jgi:hypothetical protein
VMETDQKNARSIPRGDQARYGDGEVKRTASD